MNGFECLYNQQQISTLAFSHLTYIQLYMVSLVEGTLFVFFKVRGMKLENPIYTSMFEEARR
jgi:hypothetical protein